MSIRNGMCMDDAIRLLNNGEASVAWYRGREHPNDFESWGVWVKSGGKMTEYEAVLRNEYETPWGRVTHLEVQRTDSRPTRSWPDLQAVKCAVFGNRVALEVYPARDRGVDAVNSTHLWVLPEGAAPPFGIHEGDWPPSGARVASPPVADFVPPDFTSTPVPGLGVRWTVSVPRLGDSGKQAVAVFEAWNATHPACRPAEVRVETAGVGAAVLARLVEWGVPAVPLNMSDLLAREGVYRFVLAYKAAKRALAEEGY